MMRSFILYSTNSLLVGIIILHLFYFPSAYTQELNLGFEQIDPNNNLPVNWKLNIDSNVTCKATCKLDSTIRHHGKYSIFLKKTSTNRNTLGAWYTIKLPAIAPTGTKIEFSAWVRTGNMTLGKVSNWGLSIYYKNTYGFESGTMNSWQLTSDSDWKKYSMSVTVEHYFTEFELTIQVHNNCQVWVDDIELRLNGHEIRCADSMFICKEEDISKSWDTINTNFIISPHQPLKASEVDKKLAFIKMDMLLPNLPADSVRKHPASVFFPGPVSDNAERVNRKVLISHHPNKIPVPCLPAIPVPWYSTGLYAPPGEKISIKIPDILVDKINIQIGAHTFNLRDLSGSNWERLPHVLLSCPVHATETTIASPVGGLIYITCKAETPLFSNEIEICGAICSPRYIRGKTSNEEWTEMLNSSKAPWGEFETNTLILTMPTKELLRIHSPDQVACLWDSIVEATYDLAQTPTPYGSVKQRIIPDIQVRAFAGGFSGYPISMLALAQENVYDILVNPSRMRQDPPKFMSFALLHELGHNVQNLAAIPSGMKEVTNNLSVLYVYDSVFKNRQGAVPYLTENSPREFFMAESLSSWRSNARLGFVIFQLLQSAFGWQAFKDVNRRFNEDCISNDHLPEQKVTDNLVTYFSEAVKKNLVPYFEKWDIKVSPPIKKKLTKFPVWMPIQLTRPR